MREDEYDIVEAQRAMLALVGVDVDGMTETLFRFGALGGDVDLAGVVEMLRDLGHEDYAQSDRQDWRLFTKRGHQVATMVLVVQDVTSVYDYGEEALVTRAQVCVGAALCRRNGDPSPGSAWPDELHGWRRTGYTKSNNWRAQDWLRNAGRSERYMDRVRFSRQHLPQMIAALEAVIDESGSKEEHPTT